MTGNAANDQEKERAQPRTMSFNKLFPNMLTVLALCSGLTSIRFAISEDWERSVIALVIACFLDGIDGLAARLLRGTTKFGAELDSLCDAISFGMVPSILLYLWAMQGAGTLGWALCLLYAVCGVFSSPWVLGIFLGTVSFLMVSKVPTFSIKKLRVPRQFALPMMILIALFAGFMVTETWITLGLMGLVYLGSIPFSIITFTRLSKRGGLTQEELAEVEAED